jgi:pimeloyl-ACP methyl ester carboxylesterase
MAPLIDTHAGTLWYARNRRPPAGDLPLLLVHGAGGSHLHWPAELRRLPGHTVIVPDLPGHGRSPGPGCDTIDGYAAAVVDLLDRLAIRRLVVGGHSMGGAVALSLALAHPRRVAGLVLIGTGARLRVAPALLDLVRVDPPAAIAIIVDWSFGPDAPDAIRLLGRQALAGVDPAVLHADLLACDRFDVRHRLSEIDAPALVIGAGEDRLTPPRFAEYLAANLPQALLHLLRAAGHMIALERPPEVAGAVQAFLAGLSDQG